MALPDPIPDPPLIPAGYFTANAHIWSGELAIILNRLGNAIGNVDGNGAGGFARSWTFQTNEAVQYAGGFYVFGSTDDNFAPSINFGVVNVSVAAHFFVVVGAVPVDDVTIRVTGSTINDDGERVASTSADIVIPAGTPIDSYFETPEKWNGQVTIETVSGTPVACNYGWSKYHDIGNRDFTVTGLEALWESDASDSGSNIELIKHSAIGWTFNAGSEPTPPAPVAARSIDHGPDNTHTIGPGAWKRANLAIPVGGADSEGILFRVTSGSTGIGSLSFRLLTLEVSFRFG